MKHFLIRYCIFHAFSIQNNRILGNRAFVIIGFNKKHMLTLVEPFNIIKMQSTVQSVSRHWFLLTFLIRFQHRNDICACLMAVMSALWNNHSNKILQVLLYYLNYDDEYMFGLMKFLYFTSFKMTCNACNILLSSLDMLHYAMVKKSSSWLACKAPHVFLFVFTYIVNVIILTLAYSFLIRIYLQLNIKRRF